MCVCVLCVRGGGVRAFVCVLWYIIIVVRIYLLIFIRMVEPNSDIFRTLNTLSLFYKNTHTHIYMCVCVCVRVWVGVGVYIFTLHNNPTYFNKLKG